MNITAILIALIVGFVAVTVFSLMALLFVRRRERERDNTEAERVGKTIQELDAALDDALAEINKLGALVQKEVDEKYKSVLFLYNLVEDKQKEISEAADENTVSEMVARCIDTHNAKLRLIAATASEPLSAERDAVAKTQTDEVEFAVEKSEDIAAVPKKQPKFSNAKHKQIWEMREQGQNVSAIAKELSMGQGEVKLILDLVDRAS
ncbi:MAG: hypothetical protein FWB96_11520 [Defluviitaleaceae bacterium]|nr:hypothetical protein [Defluviitaleaceae bacterium]MCL2263711.1 hypothetical protein [Defluviitaleaceae bacterium]